jgi:hypothetical protein
MREIKFRGNCTGNGEWVYGDYIYYQKYNKHIIHYYNRKNDYYTIVNPDTVGQYTGLRDATKWEDLSQQEKDEWLKHNKQENWAGKKIYEDDIVSFFHDGYECFTGPVKWQKNLSLWKVGIALKTIDPDDLFIPDIYLVVGNIHDNPELNEKINKNKTGISIEDILTLCNNPELLEETNEKL